MSYQILSKSNFDEAIQGSNKLTVIDFYADWCSPCKALSTIFEDVSDSFQNDANFFKFNISDDDQILKYYNISSVPTILILNGKEVVESIVGFIPKNKLESKILSNL